jgi:glycosyltransferase involved in cell wall biosynthesis
MPRISIILPTYNRADTIIRAIRSAQAQTVTDWELIVIDDGSTDNTAQVLAEVAESRMVVIRQPNGGMTVARNTGILAAQGEYLAFLDSDDEFLPLHLELCMAFLDTFPEEAIVSTEMLEDFGHGRVVNHYRTESSDWYVQKAAMIGSHDMDLPPGESDNYLRIYETREPIDGWAGNIKAKLRNPDDAFLYRGNVFEYMRYDYVVAITASVIRASTFKLLGLPEPRWATGSDYHYLARICQQFHANMISTPTFVKHEFSEDGKLPAFGHIVTGASAIRFAREWQATWDDLFWNGERCMDTALRRLRSLRLYWSAQAALQSGDGATALVWLQESMEGFPEFSHAWLLYWLIRCLPSAKRALRVHHMIGNLKSRIARSIRIARAL